MKKSEIIDLALKIFGIHVVIVGILFLKDLHYLKSLFTKYDSSSIDILSLVLFFVGAIITFTIGYLSKRKAAVEHNGCCCWFRR